MTTTIQSVFNNDQSGLFYDWSDAVTDSLNTDFKNDTIVLYQLGCLNDEDWDFDGDGVQNCTAACQDPNRLWNQEYSGYTLHNCMVS